MDTPETIKAVDIVKVKTYSHEACHLGQLATDAFKELDAYLKERGIPECVIHAIDSATMLYMYSEVDPASHFQDIANYSKEDPQVIWDREIKGTIETLAVDLYELELEKDKAQ